MPIHLHIGGLVAAGFDPSDRFLLTVSHAGRGVFDTATWERVARDSELAYPEHGHAVGIGPIAGVSIPVVERCDTPDVEFVGPDGSLFHYESGTLTVTPPGA